MLRNYKAFFNFLFLLLLIQVIHLMLFFISKIFLTYHQQNYLLLYGFELIVFILILFLVKRNKINFKFNSFFPNILIVVISFFILILSFIIYNILNYSFFYNLFNGKLTFLEIYPVNVKSNIGINDFVISIFIAPFLEELLFRRIIFTKLLEIHSSLKAILLTSFLFAVMHSDLNGLLGYFFMGIIFSYLYKITKSLWLNIIMHMLFNLFANLTLIKIFESKESMYFIGFVIYGVSAIGLLYFLRKLYFMGLKR
ncbi:MULTISPECIES: CPBP family intramembrane glutamic endopeptidase [unclassified Cellulophaga]|uniref:CPBP family intramembrane glutamic endopeptidase n=1 Tax=unclassified Cellulophaga TaxID=2634405 RepID=UPI0026E48BE9|nr:MULTISPECIES: type II CAAX endopeptidase family protein [unclassified Cellulophaga]MDO6495814.1 type II CAAX endopeptidase family protein [Cellulophaga sp. 3_MG-2023]